MSTHLSSLTLTGGALHNFTPPAAVTGAGRTLTAAEVLSGMIDRAMGANRTDVLPTAAELIAAMSRGGYEPKPGTSFDFMVRNQAAATDVHTLALGAGISSIAVTTLTTAAASVHMYRLVVTAGGTMALYSLGSLTT